MFRIKLADHVFEIENRYPYTQRLCRDYLTSEPAGARVVLTEEEILREGGADSRYPADYLESLAIYRKICESLLEDGIVLFHCSALAMDGTAYLFTAPSGTGKSTHARLWRERFGERVTMINDDKPLLKISDSGITVYGTPYGGKDNLHMNTSAPVGGVAILRQAKENAIRPMSAEEAYPMLLNQTYRRSDPEGLAKTLDLVWRIAELPVFLLDCTVSGEAAELACRTMRKAGK